MEPRAKDTFFSLVARVLPGPTFPKALVAGGTRVGHEEVLPPCGHFLKLQLVALCPSELVSVTRETALVHDLKKYWRDSPAQDNNQGYLVLRVRGDLSLFFPSFMTLTISNWFSSTLFVCFCKW